MTRIKVLPPGEARRIAAGEVVDRPAALVREFLDNAIDASSANIEVSIEEGGCKKVEVADDGDGMSREDLELCSLTHATSKIRSLDDLETALTLGFRGEALSAAAAVSRLEIVCSTDGREAYQLETGPGENYPPKIEQTRRTKGTTVRALNLFESTPARKKFLKREGSEGTLCRQAFIDKALFFNGINFRYVQDGRLRDFFPAVSAKKERFASALLQANESNFLHEVNVTGNGFSAVVVIGGPELYRNDRRQMFVFANGRRVNDYSLIQAMEYGAQGWFPNGTHPIGAVYVEIDPALADFNIHPAKREVRFRDPGAIHQAVSGALRNFFHSYFLRNSKKASHGGTAAQIEDEIEKDLTQGLKDTDAQNKDTFEKDITQRHEGTKARREEELGVGEEIERNSRGGAETRRAQSGDLGFEYVGDRVTKKDVKDFLNAVRAKLDHDEFSYNDDSYKTSAASAPQRLSANSSANEASPAYNEARYVGRVFGLFILIERGQKLYLIDQHAAHERILYDKFLSQPIPKQELLAPIPFCTESDDEDAFLLAKQDDLRRLGVDIEKDEDGSHPAGAWRIDALPSDWRMGDVETVRKILELRTAGENMAERWAATVCCRAAIKDGDYPDDETAFELGKQALALPQPRCPHGRPVWTEISREALFKAVRRE
jgi:DNA mismatch repair protein MutL